MGFWQRLLKDSFNSLIKMFHYSSLVNTFIQSIFPPIELRYLEDSTSSLSLSLSPERPRLRLSSMFTCDLEESMRVAVANKAYQVMLS